VRLVLSRVFIRKPVESDWKELLLLHKRNRNSPLPWVNPPLEKEGCKAYIKRCQNDDFEGFLICHSIDKRVVGVVNLSQIFYGAFHNAYLGYYVHMDFAGQGLMSEGVRLGIDYAFDTLGLHRIEANVHPENVASLRLIKRMGFTKEGYSRKYLYINGEWLDHERWALTVEDWPLIP
jgi:[ribosomal protein S5]-alanine N-acetyltransferase